MPVHALITGLTGITNEMVAGHRIDIAALEAFVADADIVVAHNAGLTKVRREDVADIRA